MSKTTKLIRFNYRYLSGSWLPLDYFKSQAGYMDAIKVNFLLRFASDKRQVEANGRIGQPRAQIAINALRAGKSDTMPFRGNLSYVKLFNPFNYFLFLVDMSKSLLQTALKRNFDNSFSRFTHRAIDFLVTLITLPLRVTNGLVTIIPSQLEKANQSKNVNQKSKLRNTIEITHENREALCTVAPIYELSKTEVIPVTPLSGSGLPRSATEKNEIENRFNQLNNVLKRLIDKGSNSQGLKTLSKCLSDDDKNVEYKLIALRSISQSRLGKENFAPKSVFGHASMFCRRAGRDASIQHFYKQLAKLDLDDKNLVNSLTHCINQLANNHGLEFTSDGRAIPQFDVSNTRSTICCSFG